MTRDLAAQLLELVAERAQTLRAAGVERFAIGPDGALSVRLAPAVIDAPAVAVVEAEPANVMQDPLAYGLPPGSKVPGFERPPAENGGEL